MSLLYFTFFVCQINFKYFREPFKRIELFLPAYKTSVHPYEKGEADPLGLEPRLRQSKCRVLTDYTTGQC